MKLWLNHRNRNFQDEKGSYFKILFALMYVLYYKKCIDYMMPFYYTFIESN